MTRKLFSKLIALVAGIVLTIVAYNHNQTSIYQINGQAYGTSWSVVSSQYIGDHHKNNIINIINNIDFVASNYKNNSEISIINNSPLNKISISNDLYKILKVAKYVENNSDGFYNIMMAKKSGEFGFSPDFGNKNIQLNTSTFRIDNNEKILYKNSSNWFDLSSVAKGYAVQVIHEYLINNDLINHMIDIGGEVIINGTKHGDSWNVGIQDPSVIQNKAIKVISNNNSKFLAIATSGEYRNFKIDDSGNRISHTINPKTLKSINNQISSVTVIHESSASYADAFATAFNAMGFTNAFDKANELNIAAMFILNNNEIIYSNKWYDLQS